MSQNPQIIMRYETALHLWTRFASVQEDVRGWVETKLSMVVKMQSEPMSDDRRNQIKVSETRFYEFEKFLSSFCLQVYTNFENGTDF